jgi:amino acid adenylation domain-containing protein
MPALKAVLIGEGAIPLRALEMLVERRFDIAGVISSTDELRSWADTRGIAHLGGSEDIDAFLLLRQPFDLLFSVVNGRLLGSVALSIPRLGAVNYHNSLLPRCAGTHASSWAILERADFHGVTWHAMTPRADAGDILIQARLPIEPVDTAQTLDLRCSELALSTFEELLSGLPGLLNRGRKQDLTRRTFYAAAQKPGNAGIISWRASAEDIDALVRASTVSPQVNRFASPLVALGDTYYVVSGLDMLTGRSTEPPGTMVGHSTNGLDVATATRDVRIRALRTLDGALVETPDLLRSLDLVKGRLLPEIDSGAIEMIARAFERIAPHEAFWVSRLETVAPLPLPSARSSPDQRESAPASDEFGTPAEIDVPVELADGVTGAISLLLAFLGRVAGMWSFDVGFSDASGRDAPPWHQRFFAPYVPLRSDFKPSWTVGQAESHTRDRLRQLAAAGTFTRDLGSRYATLCGTAGRPLWEMPIVVTVEAGAAGASWTPGVQLAIDVSLQQNRTIWRFDPGSLPPDMVRGLARGFAVFSRHAGASPAALLSELPLVDQAERQHVLMALSSTPAPFPRSASLQQLVEAQAARTPDAVAVALHHGRHELTYRQLNERANVLAHALRRLGVGPNTPVALVLDRSLELIVALVAVLKAGGAYVPFDPSWPRERLRLLLDDLEPRVVVTGQTLAATLSPGNRHILCVDAADAPLTGEACTNPEHWNTATDLASIMFTSGSTGTPKGVAVPHRAIVRLVAGTDYVPWVEKPSFLHLAPVTFDASFLEVWGPLLHGGTCVVFDGRLPDLEEIGRALDRHRVSCLWLTASLFNLVIDQQPGILGGVRHLLTGGEALSMRHVRLALAKLPRTRLVNGYGPTEGVTFTCCYSIPRPLPAHLSSIPIGRPLANTRVYVLDERQQPVPVGVPGELYIGGDGVARGYWNRPELTAERFLPDPFLGDPEARMYRSGDRCRWLPDDNLEFLGRLDDQVKLRGFRIEPGEIEAALCRHSLVRQCAVVAHQHRGEKQLAAYVVSRGERPLPQQLRAYLAEHLPSYMVPSDVVILDALPLTRSGKIDRDALSAPVPPRRLTDFASPVTPLEADITEVWKEVLGTTRVSLDDNFCDLGGTSLNLVQVHGRLTADLHLDLSLVDLVQHPTVRSLARHITRAENKPLRDLAAARALRQRQAFEEERRRRP